MPSPSSFRRGCLIPADSLLKTGPPVLATSHPISEVLMTTGAETILMKSKLTAAALTLFALTVLVACDQKKITNLDPDTVKSAEKQAGYNDVSVSVDKEKGVVALTGKVASEADKDRAGQVAQGVAGDLVVSNQLSIEPAGVESRARDIEGNVDDAIKKNFKAVLIANHWEKDDINYSVKNGVLTLKGKVPSQQERQLVEKTAASVPNVTQVVNELDVKVKS
jgi:hyperosmotically inducible protein